MQCTPNKSQSWVGQVGQPSLLPPIKRNAMPGCSARWGKWGGTAPWSALRSRNSGLFEEWVTVFSCAVIFAAWYGLSTFVYLVNPESTCMTHFYRHLPDASVNRPTGPAQASPLSLPAHCPLFMSQLQPISHGVVTVYVSPRDGQHPDIF